MHDLSISQAQADMRQAYFDGAAGVLVSGLVWLVAALVAALATAPAAVLALLVGGAMIHPLSVLLVKRLGRSGRHAASNPLGRLAIEGTVWLLAGIAIAVLLQTLRVQWFFPAMLLTIGARYLSFQTLYGLRLYWLCGAALGIAGIALLLLRAPVVLAAATGAVIELGFAGLLFRQATKPAR